MLSDKFPDRPHHRGYPSIATDQASCDIFVTKSGVFQITQVSSGEIRYNRAANDGCVYFGVLALASAESTTD